MAARPVATEFASLKLEKGKYVETSGKARVSGLATLHQPENIVIEAKTIIREHAVLHGDLSQINIGKLCVVGDGAVLQPPSDGTQGVSGHIPMTLGDYVSIGDGSIVRACEIRSCVRIGSHCVINERCMLRDCCVILDGTELAPDTVVPPFTVFGGVPGRMVAELGETTPSRMVAAAEEAFRQEVSSVL